jgi:hypothetical protein
MKLRLLCAALAGAAGLAGTASAAGPGPWKTITIAERSGGLAATLVFERRKESFGAYDFRNMRLVVKNGGKTVLDRGMCSESRCSIGSMHWLRLQNVWGDSVPEVFLDTYTGGAHCCFESLIVLPNGAHAGKTISHFWGDPGYRLGVHDGTPYLVSADDRFAYEFTSYAGSAMPIEFWAISPNGVLDNVTQTRLDAVAAEAKQFFKGYTSGRGKTDADIRGVLAAWCADEYRLGQKATCDAELSKALARGWIDGPTGWPAGAKYIALVHRQLAKWGYPAEPPKK